MRMLVEVIERVSPEFNVDDSYLLDSSVRSFANFRRTERDAYAGLASEVAEFHEFIRKSMKVWSQFRRGMTGPGDEVTIDGPMNVRYVFSVLEDAGKRTGEPWQNAYAFGPLSKWMTLTTENAGWPNHVDESRPIPYGVGHDPSGNEY